MDRKRNCHKCIHFFITWEPMHPYGCRAMGFKSRQLPSVVVLRTSGEPCMMFREKQPENR